MTRQQALCPLREYRKTAVPDPIPGHALERLSQVTDGVARSHAEMSRNLGIKIGDTIVARGGFQCDVYWKEALVTLLWRGDEVCVWRKSYRDYGHAEWSQPYETAAQELINLVWYRVVPDAIPCNPEESDANC